MNNAVILDADIFNEAKSVMKTKFPTMVQYFLEDSETYILSIREGVLSESSEKIVSPAHTLKSSSKQLGAMRVSEIAKAMEALAREQLDAGKNDVTHFVELLAQLDAAFAETKEVFQQQAA